MMVTDTQTKVADTQTKVTDTQTMVADTQTMVADMHRNLLIGSGAVPAQNHSVGATYYLLVQNVYNRLDWV